jgi:hypothetical protein
MTIAHYVYTAFAKALIKFPGLLDASIMFFDRSLVIEWPRNNCNVTCQVVEVEEANLRQLVLLTDGLRYRLP